jgi:hypothetical protein
MRRRGVFMAFLLNLAISGFGQAPVSACCELKIANSGGPTELNVVVQNIGKIPVHMWKFSAPIGEWRISLEKPTGASPERTSYGKEVSVPPSNGRLRSIVLEPGGKSTPQVLDLRKLYVLTTGVYVVTVSRDVIVGSTTREIKGTITIKVP